MQAVGCVRVSTKDQARDGVSMRAQQAKLEASCLVKDWTSRQVVRDEGHSAKTMKPLGLEALVALVASRRVAAVIVYKLDRFTRSVADLDMLSRHCRIVRGNPEEIDLMHRLRTAGYSYEAIAQHLNHSGVPTAMGGKWQAMVVWDIVRRTQPNAARRSV
jgi:predicted site-specific integrase-resolvase